MASGQNGFGGKTPRFEGFTNVKHVDMTNEVYHGSNAESVSNTRLKVHRENPQDYYQQYITGEIKKNDTPDMIFGRVFHVVVLEPHEEIHRDNFRRRTLAVFRPAEVPEREPDFRDDLEELWICSSPKPGVYRRSKLWGDLATDQDSADDDCCWVMTKEGCEIGFCAFEDFLIDGYAFKHVPDHVLSSSGSKAGKKYDAFREQHEGKVMYREAEWRHLIGMRREIYNHADAWDLLYNNSNPDSYRSEYSICGLDVATGLEVRCRIDRLKREDGRVIVMDLKTSRDASPRAWQKQADSDGLPTQAFIMTALAEEHFKQKIEYRYVVCDKDAPYRVEVFRLPPEYIEIGQDDYMRAITAFKKSVESWNWYPTSHGKTVTLGVPEWRMKKEVDHKVEWQDDGSEQELFAEDLF
jgi:hypothetical protein